MKLLILAWPVVTSQLQLRFEPFSVANENLYLICIPFWYTTSQLIDFQ